MHHNSHEMADESNISQDTPDLICLTKFQTPFLQIHSLHPEPKVLW